MGDRMELKEQLLGHQDVSPDPHQQLLTAFRHHDFMKFQNILTQGVQQSYIDPDYWFDDPHYGTLLDLACSTPSKSQFVSALLYSGATPNKINPAKNKSPLHFTIGAKDLQSFNVILDDPLTDPNILDNMGNSPLHAASKLQNTEFISKLLNHPKININLANTMGQTALHIAGKKKNQAAAELLIQAGIDLDTIKNTGGLSGRDMVVLHIPELKKNIPSKPIPKTENIKAKSLFNILYKEDTEKFILLLHRLEDIFLDYHDGHHTYLQLACDKGFYEVVRILLQRGANPNRTCPVNNRTPLMLAGYRGNSDIVRLFTAQKATSYSAVDGENVLHSIINGIKDYQTSSDGRKKESVYRDYLNCLDLVLVKISGMKPVINYGNVKGNTPLHYAAKFGDSNVILLLLKHGAYIGQRNAAGKPAFIDIDPKILEYYLDECLTTNGKLPSEDDYEIIFKYNFIVPTKFPTKVTSSQVTLEIDASSKDNEDLVNTLFETEPLLYMSHSPDFRYLLKHPVLSSFIHLKWHGVKNIFYLNSIFHVIFCLLLTCYILGVYGTQKISINDIPGVNSSRLRGTLLEEASTQSVISGVLRTLLTIFFIIFVAREMFQITISVLRYISNPENWLNITLIGFTLPILFGNKTAYQQISAITILLSWGEMILLIGRHPRSSTNLEMLKTVSWDFLKFLMWYSILIVAFALSFYMIFHDLKSSEESENNFFVNPTLSIFKTIVMSTGEFDTESIPFDSNPGVSHILFVLFVFLIAIVLFNLLSGLAVGDTQAIRANAELIGYVSQVNIISYIETMLLGNPPPFKYLTAKLRNVCSYVPYLKHCFTLFWCLMSFKKINLLAYLLPYYKIRVFPNQDNKIFVFENGQRTMTRKMNIKKGESNSEERYKNIYNDSSNITMDPKIMTAAREIVSKRIEDYIYESDDDDVENENKNGSMLLEYRKQLYSYQSAYKRFKKNSKKTQETMQNLLQLMDKLEETGSWKIHHTNFLQRQQSQKKEYSGRKKQASNWRDQHEVEQDWN